MAELKPPIIIIGSTRSGTTLLYRLLSEPDELVGLHEPNPLWRTGYAYRQTDYATETEAKPWVRAHIRRKFLEFQERHSKRRIVEKSPYNAIRIPFVREVFPEAQMVHIVRDGRASVASQIDQFRRFEGYTLTRARARAHLFSRMRQAVWWEWPAYLPSAATMIWNRLVRGGPLPFWGLRYPGWRKDVRSGAPIEVIAAKQWARAVQTALDDLEHVNSNAYIHIRYRDLILKPDETLRRCARFCEIEPSESWIENAKQRVHPDSLEKWRERLDEETLERIMPIIEKPMKRLETVTEGSVAA